MRRAKRASTDENCTGSKPWPLALTQSAITYDIHSQSKSTNKCKSKDKAHPLVSANTAAAQRSAAQRRRLLFGRALTVGPFEYSVYSLKPVPADPKPNPFPFGTATNDCVGCRPTGST